MIKNINFDKLDNDNKRLRDEIKDYEDKFIWKYCNDHIITSPGIRQKLDLLVEYFTMSRLMAGSKYVRNFIIVGSLQVGKTSFIRSLISGGNNNDNSKDFYIRNDEILMRTNLVLSPCPLILKLDNQIFLFNIVDTPGHIELANEVQLALSLSDGVVVFLDTWEGLNLLTRVLLKYFSQKKYKFFFIFTKIDRLMFELRLPPFTFFTKIKLELTKLNNYNNEINPNSLIKDLVKVSNTGFLSSKYHFFFTVPYFLNKFKKINRDIIGRKMDKRWFWLDRYYYKAKHILSDKVNPLKSCSSFAVFMILPTYKIFNLVISENKKSVFKFLSYYNLVNCLNHMDYDLRNIINSACASIFSYNRTIITTILEYFDNPLEENLCLLENLFNCNNQLLNFTSHPDFKFIFLRDYHPSIFVGAKFLSKNYSDRHFVIGRLILGSLKQNDIIFSMNNNTPHKSYIKKICIVQGKKRVALSKINNGNIIAILPDLQIRSSKKILLCGKEIQFDIFHFKDERPICRSLFKVGVRPDFSYNLLRLVNGFKNSIVCYPSVKITLWNSGEFVINGVGEFSLNLFIKELCYYNTKIKLRNTEPFIDIRESVTCPSSVKGIGLNCPDNLKIYLIAVQLDSISYNKLLKFGKLYETEKPILNLCERITYWFKLIFFPDKSFNLWSYTNSEDCFNSLMYGSFNRTISKNKLIELKSTLITGFKSCCNAGPLCLEPMDRVCFKIIKMENQRNQKLNKEFGVLQTVKNVFFSSFLLAKPVILEPFMELEVLVAHENLEIINAMLTNRGADVYGEFPVAGTNDFVVKGFMPLIDSCGVEVDIKQHTQGQASFTKHFYCWKTVIGDPLSKESINDSLENGLNRSLILLKNIRKRKGLSSYPQIGKLFNDTLLPELSVG